MKILKDLFFTFFKTGLFSFGGGYAMIPLLEEELVNKKHWLTREELISYFAIGQCTPGIIAVNVATFCGYKKSKIFGAISATLGLIFPSVVVIVLVASLLKNVLNNSNFVHIMNGVKVCVVALLIRFIFDLFKKLYSNKKNRFINLCVFISAFVALLLFKVSAVKIVLAALIVCIAQFYLKRSNK